jgi:A/G-specific adenine glycosylase
VPPADAAPARTIVAPVLAWYDDQARDLPWRAPDRTPWGVLVSEVMLQQTPVVRVEPAWRAWLARWPRPADLAAASPADVLRAWDRLGYPRRALRLQQCAAAIVERHGGEVPDDEDALRALPGVGDYTAAAVRAFAFGRRAVVLDTNVRRVLARAIGGRALPAPSQTRGDGAGRARLHGPLAAVRRVPDRGGVRVAYRGQPARRARAPPPHAGVARDGPSGAGPRHGAAPRRARPGAGVRRRGRLAGPRPT